MECKDLGLTNGEKSDSLRADGRWIPCPSCGSERLLRVGPDAMARNMPVYCKRCRRFVQIDIDAQ